MAKKNGKPALSLPFCGLIPLAPIRSKGLERNRGEGVGLPYNREFFLGVVLLQFPLYLVLYFIF